jgi:hypothetical protein
MGRTRFEATMDCSGAEDGQKAGRFQHHGTRKKGPGGTEERAAEVGLTIVVSVRRRRRRSTAKIAAQLHLR